MKSKIESEEKHFIGYLNELRIIYGIYGGSSYVVDKKLIVPENRFLVVDATTMRVTWKHNPVYKNGNYHPKIKAKIDEIEASLPAGGKDRYEKYHLDKNKNALNIDALIGNLLVSSGLDWWSKHTKEPMSIGKAPQPLDDIYDIENNSSEYNYLNKVNEFYGNRTQSDKDGGGIIGKMPIPYNLHTENGKKSIDECIEWYKRNESTTPVQDAFVKWLVSRKIKVNWAPYDFNCEKPVMKIITYKTAAELGTEREERREAFRDSLSHKAKEELREIAEKLKSKSETS